MFKESDAFIGYQEDSAAAVVFQATSLLEKHHTSRKVETAFQSDLLAQVNIDTLSEDLEAWKQAVSSDVRTLLQVNLILEFIFIGFTAKSVPPALHCSS